MLVPQPTEGATRINEPSTATIKNGEKATFTYDADGRTNDLIVPIVAMSKLPGFVYEVRSDGADRYGPARIPPTDIDDLSVCFLPALRFSDKLTVEISNVANNERVAHVQLIGWEAEDGA